MGSKLGLHVSAGNHSCKRPGSQGGNFGLGEMLAQCADAGSPVPVIFSLDQDVWPDVEWHSPATVLIFRTQQNGRGESVDDGPGSMYQGDPIKTAHDWMQDIMPKWFKNRAHYYAPLNEQDPPDLAGFAWLNDFTVTCLNLAEANGYKLALYAFSTGNPKDVDYPAIGEPFTRYDAWQKFLPSLRLAQRGGHILLLHEYGLDAESKIVGVPGGSLRASAPDLALRYRSAYAYLPADARPRLVISEASMGVGYTGNSGAWLDDAKWYDSELLKDPQVIGCCLYQLGGAENFAQLLPLLSDYIAHQAGVTPVPQPGPEPDPEPWPKPEPITGLTIEERVIRLEARVGRLEARH